MAEYCFPSYSILFPIITLTCCVHVGHDVAVLQRRVRTLSRSVPGDSDFLRQFACCITFYLEVLSRKHLASGLFFFNINTLRLQAVTSRFYMGSLSGQVSVDSLLSNYFTFIPIQFSPGEYFLLQNFTPLYLPFPHTRYTHWAFFTTSGE